MAVQTESIITFVKHLVMGTMKTQYITSLVDQQRVFSDHDKVPEIFASTCKHSEEKCKHSVEKCKG